MRGYAITSANVNQNPRRHKASLWGKSTWKLVERRKWIKLKHLRHDVYQNILSIHIYAHVIKCFHQTLQWSQMTKMASQITSLAVVYSIVYSDADQRKHQSSASLAFVWGIHWDRWIPRTKGQLRGKCFHLMTSSWSHSRSFIYNSLAKKWASIQGQMLNPRHKHQSTRATSRKAWHTPADCPSKESKLNIRQVHQANFPKVSVESNNTRSVIAVRRRPTKTQYKITGCIPLCRQAISHGIDYVGNTCPCFPRWRFVTTGVTFMSRIAVCYILKHANCYCIQSYCMI